MYTVSIFPSRQYFIALYSSLFSLPQKGTPFLSQLLKRTKNPPISAIYTYQFLQQKSDDQYSLDIIRFVSQLSDLSDGASVSTSLQHVIEQSSLLTEIRHNLTHKIMIEGQIIQMCRSIILNQLEKKYWKSTYSNYCEQYLINKEKVHEIYEEIYGIKLDKFVCREKLTEEELIQCSPYTFKQFFPFFIRNTFNLKQVLNAFVKFSQFKKSIAFRICVDVFLQDHNNEDLTQLLVKLIETNTIQFQDPIIMKKIKKLSFIHYLGLCRKVLNRLPESVQQQLCKHWQKVNEKLKMKKSKEIYNIYQ